MTLLTFGSVDDYLGPADERFFGAGYRRSELDLSDVEVGPDTAEGTLAVGYPSDWSRKKVGIDLRPHLSTVDGLLVAVQLTDALLTNRLGLSQAGRAAVELTKIVVQAGTEPDEDLGALPVRAAVRRSTTDDDGRSSTVVDVSVGRMRLRCHVAHPAAAPGADAGSRTVLDVLGDPARRFWGEGYRASRQAIRDVVVDVARLHATADLTTATLPATVDEGLGGRPDPVTVVDAFVSSLQVFQILLYELDGLSRAESNTLWMQQTTLTLDPERRDARDLTVDITASELIELANGTWRNLTFDAVTGPVRQRSVFAHHLPVGAAALSR
ncbi:hypothetical protein Cch01nite_24230 [Cellulomonas chitinilytica]|uniref:Avirulence D protein (AvrD) n=1 Tax=Cellulomonas chitinilytica TaxID=398759 RepID=A0A919U315_9CELL|nr:AvrD family protein [Cellulomonas chitinilytica]GIG21699.1 hypothetical protein Cch01nite_24230 [Cellulomonas chitinilytica]